MPIPTTHLRTRALPIPPPPVTNEVRNGQTVCVIQFNASDLVNFAEAHCYFREQILHHYGCEIDLTKVRTLRNRKYQLTGLEYVDG